MARALKLNLPSQAEIRQEGNPEPTNSVLVEVGRLQLEFFVPELKLDGIPLEEGSPRVQQVVHKINQFIENIADDYFLLGLHLIALHRLLKDSGLTTDQVKLWYAESVNMPYSSAMQCRKVAEVYEDQPELIGRYTASGAYLLTTCANHEEREAVWQQARGDKETPSVRDLRITLREFKEVAERAFLLEKLREHGWNISKTAEEIDTPRSNLYKKLEQYQIRQDSDA